MLYWDTDAWEEKSKDKAWQAARKEEWKKVQYNLKQFSQVMFRGSFMMAHKNLFFKGEYDADKLDEYGDKVFHYALPIFLLWYHPDPTEQVVNNIVDFHCETITKAIHLAECRGLVDQLDMLMMSSLQENYSMFGGREKIIVRMLWGEPVIGGVFDNLPEFTDPRVQTQKGALVSESLVMLVFNALFGILRDGHTNQYRPGQYLIKHLVGLKHGVDDDLNRIMRIFYDAIYFEQSPCTDKNNPISQKMCKTLLEHYQNKDFPEQIQKAWEEVENNGPDFKYNQINYNYYPEGDNMECQVELKFKFSELDKMREIAELFQTIHNELCDPEEISALFKPYSVEAAEMIPELIESDDWEPANFTLSEIVKFDGERITLLNTTGVGAVEFVPRFMAFILKLGGKPLTCKVSGDEEEYVFKHTIKKGIQCTVKSR